MACNGRVVIAGGAGALGSQLVRLFAEKQWWTCCVDRSESCSAACNVLAGSESAFAEYANNVLAKVDKCLNGQKVDAVISVAGGWAGGNAASDDFFDTCSLIWQQSVWTSVVASKLASSYLKDDGLLLLTGAAAALDSTPGMMAYGMAKAAVHQMTKSLGSASGGLPQNATALCMLPTTLDTLANRKSMPKANFSNWTPLEFVCSEIFKWTRNKADRPNSGSLLKFITKNGVTNISGV